MSKKRMKKKYPWPKKTTWGVHWKIENGKWVKKDGPPGIRHGQNFDARDSFCMFTWMSIGFLFLSIAGLFIIDDELPSLIFFTIFFISAVILGAIAIYALLSWREDIKNEENVRKAREEKQRLWRENQKKLRESSKRK